MSWFAYLFVALAGVVLATQPATTSSLARQASFASFSALYSFLTGLIIVIIYFLIETKGGEMDYEPLGQTPWWAWTGGVAGALYIITISIFTKDLGASVLIGILIAAQVLVGALIDHFGVLGMDERPITLPRGIGVGLIILGAVLLTIFSDQHEHLSQTFNGHLDWRTPLVMSAADRDHVVLDPSDVPLRRKGVARGGAEMQSLAAQLVTTLQVGKMRRFFKVMNDGATNASRVDTVRKLDPKPLGIALP